LLADSVDINHFLSALSTRNFILLSLSLTNENLRGHNLTKKPLFFTIAPKNDRFLYCRLNVCSFRFPTVAKLALDVKQDNGFTQMFCFPMATGKTNPVGITNRQPSSYYIWPSPSTTTGQEESRRKVKVK
jgi:hypothetical protein